MEMGQPKKTIVIHPLEVPVPRKTPVAEPTAPEREKVPVPA